MLRTAPRARLIDGLEVNAAVHDVAAQRDRISANGVVAGITTEVESVEREAAEIICQQQLA